VNESRTCFSPRGSSRAHLPDFLAHRCATIISIRKGRPAVTSDRPESQRDSLDSSSASRGRAIIEEEEEEKADEERRGEGPHFRAQVAPRAIGRFAIATPTVPSESPTGERCRTVQPSGTSSLSSPVDYVSPRAVQSPPPPVSPETQARRDRRRSLIVYRVVSARCFSRRWRFPRIDESIRMRDRGNMRRRRSDIVL